MGGEFGQRREWTHDDSLEWHVLQYPLHQGVQRWVADLNRVYSGQTCACTRGTSPRRASAGCSAATGSRAPSRSCASPARTAPPVLVVCNFTPVPRLNYRVGVPRGGYWREILNSDAQSYGGSGLGNFGGADAVPMPYEEYSHSLTLTLPPLAAVFLKPD